MTKSATLYRMKLTDHMCPYGLKSKDLLKRNGYKVVDQHLTSREQVDEFKAQHSVKTTPQTFIEGELSVAVTWLVKGALFSTQTIPWFIAISMVLLGLQKLQDIENFATMFLNYDLLAQKWVRYGYVYPFVETVAGLLMMMGILTWLSAPATLLVASVGAISVIKAVYIDKREIKCACLGDSRVPLGFVSLTENLMMIGMALWMLWSL